MKGGNETPDTSDFASVGAKPFPPIYEHAKDVRNFSDFNKYPSPLLMTHLKTYLDFVEREDPMPRAKESTNRIIAHLLFELSFREGIYDAPEKGEE